MSGILAFVDWRRLGLDFLGLPGTPMPATQDLAPTDLADLVAYV